MLVRHVLYQKDIKLLINNHMINNYNKVHSKECTLFIFSPKTVNNKIKSATFQIALEIYENFTQFLQIVYKSLSKEKMLPKRS